MGDVIYQEIFDEESQVEVKENDLEEMEGVEYLYNENVGSDLYCDCSDEIGEVVDFVIVEDIELGIYYGILNENYYVGFGISKFQFDDIVDILVLYLWCKNVFVDIIKIKMFDLGIVFYCWVFELEEFSNCFIVVFEFNCCINVGKEEEKVFLMECVSIGKMVIIVEEGWKIEFMY